MTHKMKVSIVGTGNVGTHLYKALRKSPETSHALSVTLINPHTLDNLPDHSDILLIAVKDDVIIDVARRVKDRASLVAHTSGSVPLSAIVDSAPAIGVFYPLQTFSKETELNYEEIPFFIEGNSRETSETLKHLASLISEKVYEADSSKRKLLHISAVFACNFSNHLVAIADRLLKKEDLDYRVLLPLINETVNKLGKLSPADAQTGPAVRNDITVMSSHEEMLQDTPDLKTLYQLLSSSIIKEKENDI